MKHYTLDPEAFNKAASHSANNTIYKWICSIDLSGGLWYKTIRKAALKIAASQTESHFRADDKPRLSKNEVIQLLDQIFVPEGKAPDHYYNLGC